MPALIDKQTVIDEIEYEIEMINSALDSITLDFNARERLRQRRGEAREILNSIQQLPTAQSEQRWTPCSERFPEEDDYKSCIECLDGAVWYFTENGTMGLGYYYKSTKEWSTTGDLKTDGKVIAWKPLPEPYERRQE